MNSNDLYIIHYGVGHDKGGHSGRYPWGSGKNPYGGTKNITEKDAKKFNNKYSKHFSNNSVKIEKSKEKKEFEYATFQLIDLFCQKNNISRKDFFEIYNSNPEARKDFITVMMDDGTTIPSMNHKKVKDIVNSYRQLFQKVNGEETKMIEDFLKKYDAKTLYDLDPDYKEYDLQGTMKKYGKNRVEVSRIIRNAYDKNIGLLDKNSRYNSTNDKEWLTQFLDGAFK